MVEMTQSFEHWMLENHKDIIGLVFLGHTELVTDEMYQEYLDWCKTEEGMSYLKGGENYKEEG